jgi:hypothetical protein
MVSHRQATLMGMDSGDERSDEFIPRIGASAVSHEAQETTPDVN